MNDLIQDIFVTSVTSQVTWQVVVMSITAAFILGRAIVFFYNRAVENQLPQDNVPTFITMISMVTTMVIIPISVNAVLSLGMVGALSVVRFRTAIKSPTDTAFIYWAIAVGISLGAGFFVPAIVGTFMVGMLLEVNRMFDRQHPVTYIVNLELPKEQEEEFNNVEAECTGTFKVLSRVFRGEQLYVTIETDSVDNTERIKGINNIVQLEIVSLQQGLVS